MLFYDLFDSLVFNFCCTKFCTFAVEETLLFYFKSAKDEKAVTSTWVSKNNLMVNVSQCQKSQERKIKAETIHLNVTRNIEEYLK